MAHARQIIREAFVSALTGLTTTGLRVFEDRVTPAFNLPSLNVMVQDETVRNDLGYMEGLENQIRELRVMVEGRAKEAIMPDTTIETIADEVEDAVLNDGTLNGYAFDLTLESTEFSYTNEGNIPIEKLEMVFSFLYVTDGRSPSSIL